MHDVVDGADSEVDAEEIAVKFVDAAIGTGCSCCSDNLAETPKTVKIPAIFAILARISALHHCPK
jgi:predicted aldo/keto reductase-like oxidoreductase